jgi:hypothetical protein
VVIPVFNGAGVVADTIGGCVSFFERHGLPHEIVLVDDASADGTWGLLARMVAQKRNLVAVRLSKNAGQQIATMCGLRVATGDYVITMDVDLSSTIHPRWNSSSPGRTPATTSCSRAFRQNGSRYGGGCPARRCSGSTGAPSAFRRGSSCRASG